MVNFNRYDSRISEAKRVATQGQGPDRGWSEDDRLGAAEFHDIARQTLKRLPVDWKLGPADLPRLMRRMQARRYAPGEVVLAGQAQGDCFGIIVRGRVAVRVEQSGVRRWMTILLPGGVVGGLIPTGLSSPEATWQAVTRCEVRFLHRADLEAVRAEWRREQQAARLQQLTRIGAVLLVAMLAAIVALSVPSARQAIALVPMGLGQWCDQQGSNRCAELAWRVAANLAPADPNPLLALGVHYVEEGDLITAEQLFEKARSLKPDSPEVHNNLGRIYAQRGEYERAISAFRQAVALDPGSAIIRYNLAYSLQAIQAYEEALDHYEAALALEGPNPQMLMNMAIAYSEMGQMGKAAEMARQALLSDSTLAPAHTVLGAAALQAGRADEALSRLQQAVALDAEYVPAFFYLGLAYKSLGQFTEAIAAFERALARSDSETVRARIRTQLNELYDMEAPGGVP